MVLRRTDKNNYFKLITDAYVEGAMQGEIVSAESSSHGSLQQDMDEGVASGEISVSGPKQSVTPNLWKKIMIR